MSTKHDQGLPLSRTQKTIQREVAPYKEALREVLDSIGALGGSWWELCGHGIPEERAKEITQLAESR